MKQQQYWAIIVAFIASLTLFAGCNSRNVVSENFAPTPNAQSSATPQGETVPAVAPKAKATSTLSGTKWVSTSNNLHSIEFGSDNSVSGIAGCNVYNGFYGEVSQGLNFTSITETKNTCAQSIMLNASVFIDLLRKISNFQKIGETIILKDSKNATLLVMKKQAI